MRFAVNDKNEKIEVSKSGELAKCPVCNSILIGNKGEFRPKYWRHKVKDCDTWGEQLTEWHLKWQNYFPKENQEVILKDFENNISHRADICLNNGLVIEIQNSPITKSEIEQRETFYGKNKMIWVINGQTLAKKSYITYKQKRRIFILEFCIPWYSEIVKEYSYEDFMRNLFQSDIFLKIYKDPDISNYSEKKGYFHFTFEKEKDFSLIKKELDDLLSFICCDLYGYSKYRLLSSKFKIHSISHFRDSYEIVYFSKKFWRQFLDEMKFPLFIHQLPGLEDDLLFWYQENKIVSRNDFIKKYLKYT